MAVKKYDLEDVVHQQIADHLRIHYPSVLFHSDFGSGIKLTMKQAKKQKQLNGGRRGWPDLFIAQKTTMMVPAKNGGVKPAHYGGFMIELKKEGTTIHLKNGELVADKHIREQAAVLEELRKRGYKAEFGVGFEATKKIIDEYLGGAR